MLRSGVLLGGSLGTEAVNIRTIRLSTALALSAQPLDGSVEDDPAAMLGRDEPRRGHGPLREKKDHEKDRPANDKKPSHEDRHR